MPWNVYAKMTDEDLKAVFARAPPDAAAGRGTSSARVPGAGLRLQH